MSIMNKPTNKYRVDIPIYSRKEQTATKYGLLPAALDKMKELAAADGRSVRQFVAAAVNAKIKQETTRDSGGKQ